MIILLSRQSLIPRIMVQKIKLNVSLTSYSLIETRGSPSIHFSELFREREHPFELRIHNDFAAPIYISPLFTDFHRGKPF